MRFASFTSALALALLTTAFTSPATAASTGENRVAAPVATTSTTATTSAVFSKNAELGRFNHILIEANAKHLLKHAATTYTVFAPTNTAVAKVPARIRERMFRAEAPGLKRLVKTHMAAGNVNLAQLTDGAEIMMLSGEVLRVAKRPNGDILLNGVYRVGQPQVTANGLVYPIETMIAPTL